MTVKTIGWLTLAMATAGLIFLAPLRNAAAEPTLSQPQLEQIAAPIALYPDELIAQVLDAAQYPQDVVAASQWRSTVGAGLGPDEVAAALRDKPWAASVKALVNVPDILYAMSNDLNWTMALGRAQATQDAQLLAAIQELRRRAAVAGNLRTVPQQLVEDDGQIITIYPAMNDAIALPYYDPNRVYGVWPWNGFPPYYFAGLGGWGPGIIFMTSVYVGPHWHRRRLDWNRNHDRGPRGDRKDWHRNDRGAAVGRSVVPVAPAAAPQAGVVIAPPARTFVGTPAPPRFRNTERPAGQVREVQREAQRSREDRARMTVMPSVAAPAPLPRAPVAVVPPVRVAVPIRSTTQEFRGDTAPPHNLSAPAKQRSFQDGEHAGGRERR